jgi:two-component system, sensor histidine kinase PdtaS
MLDTLERWRKTQKWDFGVAAAVFLVSFGVRYSLDAWLPPGLPFLTFFPAVLLATFFAGVWPGVLVAVSSVLAAWYFFLPPLRSFALDLSGALALVVFVLAVAPSIVVIHILNLTLERLQMHRENAETLAGERATAHERVAVLLQELGHRIKNSLQIIVAMVSLEARNHKSGEGRAALERVSHRIAALGRLYSILGSVNAVEEVDAAAYLEALCRDLIESVQKENGTSIALKTDIESEPLPADRAIPLGLIVNELVTNAVKYAFPSETRGTVVVTLKRIPGELRLTVSDDGKGVDPRRTDSGVGGRLVETFARQLGGQVERESGNKGTIVCLTLPSREASYDLRA